MESGTVVWRDAAQSLLRRKWLVLGCVALGVVGALAFALPQQKTWTGSSQIVVGPVVPPALVGKLPPGTDKTGPLGMDLPAETQARVIASPALLREVAKSLGLPTSDGAVQQMATVTRVKAVTDNAYLITTEGPTANEAVRRANAIARSYLARRTLDARELLDALAHQADQRASAANSQATGLLPTLSDALRRGDTQTVSTLRDRRVALQSDARVAKDEAAAMRAAAQSAGSTSQLVTPATTETALVSPRVGRDAVVGGILGLVFGLGVTLLGAHLSPYVATRDDAARAAGAPVIGASVGGRRWWRRGARPLPAVELTALGAEAVAALARHQPGPSGTPALLVLSASQTQNSSGVAVAMAEATARDGRETLLVLADLRGGALDPRLGVSQHEAIQHEGLTDIVDEPVSTRAVKARKLLRPGSVPELRLLPPGLSRHQNAVAVAPSLVPGIVAEVAAGRAVFVHGPAADGTPGVAPLAAAVDGSVLVVQVGYDKENEVSRLTAALKYAGAPVLGVVLVGVHRTDDSLGIPPNFDSATTPAGS